MNSGNLQKSITFRLTTAKETELLRSGGQTLLGGVESENSWFGRLGDQYFFETSQAGGPHHQDYYQ